MANNSLTIDLNTSPYYDDFDESKGYYRILFKPSLAVQARELTQMQTILQKQIDRFGEHVFDEGSLVLGGQTTIDSRYKYLRIQDTNSLSQNVNPSSFVSKTFTSNTSAITATVLDYKDGAEASFPDTKTFFVRLTNSGANTTAIKFDAGEELVTSDGFRATLLANTSAQGNGYVISIENGVVYAKDHFIKFPSQKVIVDPYSTTPTKKVGFMINESIVNFTQDSSLLDPASGSPNVNGPGADRLKLDAELVSLDRSNTSPDFVLLYDIKNGVIQEKLDTPQYSIIEKEWAKRTYEESGNYVVNGLKTTLNEHLNDGSNGGYLTLAQGGDSQKLAASISPGKAYILGYRVDRYTSIVLDVDKGIDYENVEQQSISANYGNYVMVDELVGHLDVNNGPVVSIYDAPTNRISTGGYSSASPAGNLIGTARAKTISHEAGVAGTSNASYRLYLYDLQMTGNTFSSARSIYFNNGSTSNFGCDLILENGVAVIKEINFNRSIFEIPAKNIRKIRDDNDQIDTNYIFQKSFNVSIGTGGTFSITTGSASDLFPFSTGLLNATQKRDNFFVALDSSTSVDISGTVDITTGTTVTGTGTSFTTELNEGDKITVDSQTKIVTAISSDTQLTVDSGFSAGSSGESIVKQYLPGDIIDFGINSRTIDIATTTSAQFDMNESLTVGVTGTVICNLSKIDGREIRKVFRPNRYVQIRCSDNVANTSGPWDLGISDVFRINSVRVDTSPFSSASQGSDVTSAFVLDSGQKDNFYGHSKIKKKSGPSVALTSGSYLLVDLDYFYHDFSQGDTYFSVDSYPIDDANIANTSSIQTQEIPVFTSPVTGNKYNLRDCVDTRPSELNTASDTQVVSSASVNPTASSALNVPTGGLKTPTPNENFTMDMSFYLPRKDVISVDSRGRFSVIRGVPSLTPITPESPPDAMTLSVITVAPYPSLPPKEAARIGRNEYTCGISDRGTKRYTMREIGLLDQRLKNVEDYVSITLLEKDTLDLKIPDENGIDRFKNGILVDPFKDHSIGDKTNPDYSCSIDRIKNELRPKFTMDDIKSKFMGTSANVTRHNNDVITLPYTHTLFAEQPFATNTRNLAGAFYSYKGTLTLNPNLDYWIDTTRAPDISITDNSAIEFYSAMADALTSDWSSWSTVWTGTVREPAGNGWQQTITTTTVEESTRNRFSVNTTGTSTESYGDRIIDSSLQPYMRSRNIEFQAHGVKSSTKLYSFFDGKDVSDYITPANSSFGITGNEGDDLISDSAGDVYGIFRIPNDETLKFGAGTKTLLLKDSPIFSDPFLTAAEASYTAQGMSQTKQETIVSTAQAELVSETETRSRENNTVTSWTPPQTSSEMFVSSNEGNTDSGGPSDPIAQTFSVSVQDGVEGIFVTKLDLYFASKSSSYGVEIQIREVDNLTAYITNKIIPYSRVRKSSSEINTSEDGTVATTFTFSCPLFLMNNKTYAITAIPEGNNPDTTLWTSRLGEIDLITGANVQKQPFTGVMFLSSNDRTWSPIQDEDFKFELYRASFNTGVTGNLVLANEDEEFFTVASPSSPFDKVGDIVHGETRLEVNVSGGTINITDKIVGDDSGAVGIVTYVSGSSVRVKGLAIDTKFNNGEDITVTDSGDVTTGVTGTITSISVPTAKVNLYRVFSDDNIFLKLSNSSGNFIVGEELKSQIQGKTCTISSIDDKPFNLIDMETSALSFNRTRINWFLKTTENNTLGLSFTKANINTNNEFVTEKEIRSLSNESGTKSLQSKAEMSSTTEFLSPVVDLNRTYNVFVHNLINNDSTGEDGVEGGNALARYISPTVTLREGQDAEDIIVRLTAYKPPATDIKIYYKILNGEDSDTIESITWNEMRIATKSSVFSSAANTEDFIEFEYGLPEDVLTGPNAEVQYTNSQGIVFTGYKYFKFKIVMLSTSSGSIPRCQDFRSIALQK